MTLPFSIAWPKHMKDLAGQPNYFPYKILEGLFLDDIIDYDFYQDFTNNKAIHKNLFVKPKFHTLRTDPKNRWKAGMPIHFVIHNRTKRRFQFAPITKCVSVQKIQIIRISDKNKVHSPVLIDNVVMNISTVLNIATNDGFPSLEAFFDYFNTDFEGKIIHWTDRR